MFELLTLKNKNLWDSLVMSFKNYDVYYLSGYVESFELHGDGQPILIYYENKKIRALSVMMKRDISLSSFYEKKISSGLYFDLITPYGYGGFLFEGELNDNILREFKKLYISFLKSENIVSSFVRFHPVLNNAKILKPYFNILDLGKTIDINTETEEIIKSNIKSKDRNTIRRSIRDGVVIHHSKELSLFNDFQKIYNATMDYAEADSYYYFSMDFYKSIHLNLYNNYEMFFAEYKGEIIAMTIILFANTQMHYHLSCSLFEYRKLNATNLLLYEAALWGSANGFKTFHLGGGVGSKEDSLFKFKQSFNRNSENVFSIGKCVVDQIMYDKLVEERKRNDDRFDLESSFFPLYRV